MAGPIDASRFKLSPYATTDRAVVGGAGAVLLMAVKLVAGNAIALLAFWLAVQTLSVVV